MADLHSKNEAFTRIFNRVNGILVPPFITKESVEKEAASLTLDNTDVWIVTYPKAGTTWTQQIVKLLRSRGEGDDNKIDKSIPWLEANAFEFYQVDVASLPKPRAFKSHFPYEAMPFGRPNTTPCKYIYVARNPKDVAVSYYFHYQRIKEIPNLEWSQFFDLFIKGELSFGDYFDHFLSWWAHKDDENVLFLKFEDMKKDLLAAVARIAKFIECDVTDEIIAKVVAKTSFDAMKRDDTANVTWLDTMMDPSIAPFMRKGEVGDWKNYFTPEQSAEMDKVCHERLDGSGLVFDFGDTHSC